MPLALVTAEDAAYYTGRPVGTIWRWASEGRISRYGTGKAVRYNVHELPGRTIDEMTGDVRLGNPPPMPQRARKAA